MGDKTRLSILKILDRTECCVCHFAEVFGMSQSAISQHIRRLKVIGLISEDPRKQWVFYSLNTDSELYPFIKAILDRIPDHLVDIDAIEANMAGMSC